VSSLQPDGAAERLRSSRVLRCGIRFAAAERLQNHTEVCGPVRRYLLPQDALQVLRCLEPAAWALPQDAAQALHKAAAGALQDAAHAAAENFSAR